MNELMRKDRFHIAMEDISPFPLERSEDREYWEKISQSDLGKSMGGCPAFRNLSLTGTSPISAGNNTSDTDSSTVPEF